MEEILNKAPYQIFISFTSKDVALKDKLKTKLSSLENISPYVDVKTWDMDVDCSGLWDEACQQAIKRSNAFICLLTDNILSNSVVHKEIDLAIECAKKNNLIVFPLVLTDNLESVTSVNFKDFTNIFSKPKNGKVDLYEEALEEIYNKIQSRIEIFLKTPQMKDIKDYPQNENFVGRDFEMQQIKKAFDEGLKSVVLYGLGGIGKSELVRQFAQRYKKEYPNVYIVEMDASDGEKVDKTIKVDETDSTQKRSLKDLLLRLRFVGTPNSEDTDEIYRYNLNALRNLPTTTIIIFDGYDVHLDTVYEIEEFNSNINCEVIITSRQKSKKIKTIQIDALPIEEAKIAFRKYCTKREINDNDLEKLLENIDRHTLTIELVAKLLENSNPKLTPTDKVLNSFFDINRQIELDRINNKKGNSTIETIYKHVSNVLSLSNFTQFKKNVLSILSRICRQGIIEDDLIPLANMTEETEYELDELVNASFVIKKEDKYSLHPIISEIAYREIELAEETDIEIITWFNESALDLDESKNIIEKSCIPEYGEHYIKNRIRKTQSDDYSKELGTLYSATAYVYNHLADYSKALEYYSKALEIQEKVLGINHQDTATIYNNIGGVYNALGNYEKALESFSKALAIEEKGLKINDNDIASCFNNIGSVYDSLGDYDKALEYYIKALEIVKKVLGINHQDTATSYNNVGSIYNVLGDYDKALEYFNKALKIREKVLGLNHPDTAASYNNIAMVSYVLGNYNKALEYIFKALKIQERVLGLNHSNTATSYNNIGYIYNSIGEFNKALEYYNKALKIKERLLGLNHPDTATIYNNIGQINYSLGNYDKALEYFNKALEIQEEVLGYNHPDTANSYNNMGCVYNNLGDYSNALECFSKSLEIRERVLGVHHTNTANAYNNIGLVYNSLRDYDIALDYYNKALEIQVEVLGINHPDTARSYNNIGHNNYSLGNYDKALEYFNKALEIQEEVLGLNTIDTANSYNNIGGVYNALGNYNKALEYYSKAAEIQEEVLGINHPDTARSYIEISNVYIKLGNQVKALEYFNKAKR